MSYLFDGTGDWLKGSMASVYSDTSITLACFLKVAAHPLEQDYAVNFGNSSSSANNSYQLRTHSTDNVYRAGIVTSGGTLVQGGVTLNIDGVWAGWVGVYTGSGASRTVYVQAIGSTGTGSTADVVGNSLQHVQVGANLADAGTFTGRLAEVAIWNTALSTQDITDYLAGIAASSLSAANLIGYWPLSASNATQTNEGTDATGDLTVTGATYDSDHPTITIPSAGAAPSLFTVRSAIRLGS